MLIIKDDKLFISFNLIRYEEHLLVHFFDFVLDYAYVGRLVSVGKGVEVTLLEMFYWFEDLYQHF